MSRYLLDTNCISEVVRINPEPRVLSWMEAAEETLLYLSVLTLGEIRKGVAALMQGKRRTLLETWLEVELQARFAGRILSIDAAVADRWGVLAAGVKAKGATLSTIDGLLAATALHHNLTIVSRNVGDFANAQVSVLNPWKA
jgi:predicted nucleic acid-binding protein